MKKHILIWLMICPGVYAQQTLLKANNNYPLISESRYSEMADIDGDGQAELLLATSSNQGLLIFSVAADGQYKAWDDPPKVPAFINGFNNSVMKSFTLFDVDEDQDLDIWVSNVNIDYESMLLINDGHGQFTKKWFDNSQSTSFEGVDLLVGDVDNDGDLDLVKGTNPYEAPQSFYTYLNDGTGQFTRQEIYYPRYRNIHSNHLADFDQDGYLDLWRLHDNLYIYLNDQTGQFNSQPLEFRFDFLASNREEGFIHKMLFADINQDGHIDVQAFSNFKNLPRAINNGDGTFTEQPTIPYDQEPSQQLGVMLDVNGDQMLDLWVSTNQSNYVVLTDAQGFVDMDSKQQISTTQMSKLLSSDINSDGLQDIVGVGLDQLALWQQTAPSSFEQVAKSDDPDRWGSVYGKNWVDLDGDGHKDLVQINGKQVKYRAGNGRGGLGNLKTTGINASFDLDLADLNGDGVFDLVTSSGTQLLVSIQSGNGAYSTTSIQPTDEVIVGFDLADFDGDSDVDLLVHLADYDSGVGHPHIYENDGQGGFALKAVLPHSAVLVEFADLQQNGASSVILISEGISFIADQLFEYQYNGNSFDVINSISLETPLRRVLGVFFEDEDGDGDLDILLSQTVNLKHLEWVINNNSGFSFKNHPFARDSFAIARSDINNDGFTDIIGIQPEAIYLDDQNGGFQTINFNAGQNPLLVDLDNDGDTDIIRDDQLLGQTAYLNTTIDQDYNGLWYNASEDGHGLQVQEIVIAGQPHVLASWYVFNDGQPIWLIGTGPISDSQAVLSMTITTGPDFGENYNSDDLVINDWGSLILTLSNNSLQVDWDGTPSGFSQGSITMERLAEIKAVDPTTSGLNSCHSGAWYNAAEDGHGYLVQVTQINEAPHMVLTWYTYQNMEQVWLTAAGEINDKKAILQAYSASGGNFPPDFVANDVVLNPWGTIEFELINNDQALVKWQPTQSGFAAGELAVSRLTAIDRYRCN